MKNYIKCIIDGEELYCKITENMGFQNGVYVRAVEYKGKERIVKRCAYHKVYRERTVYERFN